MKTLLLPAAAIVWSLASLPLSAATILLDLGDGQGTPPSPDANGNTWNQIVTSAGETLSLMSTTNTATGWSVSLTQTSSDSGYTGSSLNVAATGAPADFAMAGAYNDGYFDNTHGGSISTIAFTGLGALADYTLTLWGSRNTGGAASGADADIAVTTGTAAGGPAFTLVMATPLVIDVTTDASGNFAFTFDKAEGSGITGLNVLSLAAVPEPSAACLGGAALLGLLVRRRRSRAASA